MTVPDAQERPGKGAPRKLAAKLASEANGTSSPSTAVGDAAHVLVLEAELDGVLADRREVSDR